MKRREFITLLGGATVVLDPGGRLEKRTLSGHHRNDRV
jgi:hypothetical protein